MMKKTIILLTISGIFTGLYSSERENPIPVKLRPVLHVTGGGLIAYVTAFGLEKIEPEKISLGERCVVGIFMGILANFVKEAFIDHRLGYDVSIADIGLGSGGSVLGAGCYYLQERLQKRKKEKKAEIYLNLNSIMIVYNF